MVLLYFLCSLVVCLSVCHAMLHQTWRDMPIIAPPKSICQEPCEVLSKNMKESSDGF